MEIPASGRDLLSHLRPAALDEPPDGQQAPRQAQGEDEDVEDDEGAHLVVDDACVVCRSSCRGDVGGVERRDPLHLTLQHTGSCLLQHTERKRKQTCCGFVGCLPS